VLANPVIEESTVTVAGVDAGASAGTVS
jgi:hypothetical protein